MPTIGSSDLTVAPLALGSNTFGWTSDKETSFAVLDKFTAQGGNLVDTADSYSVWVPGNSGGDSEEILGEWFSTSGKRDQLVLATKVAQHPQFPGLSAQNVAKAADASLKRLHTDHIDLYYAHQEDPDVPVAESVTAFAKLQQEGKIRHVGLSNFSAPKIREWFNAADEQGVERPVAYQPHYNLVYRKDYEENLRSTVQEFGMGVLPYWGLAAGLLTGKYKSAADIAGERAGNVRGYASPEAFAVVDRLREIAQAHGVQPASVALHWLGLQPTIVAPIASARTPEQVDPLIASIDVELSGAEIGDLDQLSGLIK
ncbi:MAG: aldo/keto reductase [Ancrocorticia sp.]|uniref:aldo/keto reductase n=1 Tax=Ancrocorticia sp. TaxID=2593684 RepID=UPI003F925CFE